MLGSQLVARMQPSVDPNVGEEVFTTPGTYSWTVPANVTSISVVCVGGGGNSNGITGGNGTSGSGGALAYRNDLTVTPGSSLTVVVGGPAGNSSVNTSPSVEAGGGTNTPGYPNFPPGGAVISGSGGAGGAGGYSYPTGGGGAGGYSGAGGRGQSASFGPSWTAGSGGGGAGGSNSFGGGGGGALGGGGGGVGLYGEGASGTNASEGGSGGTNGNGFTGGLYGGGAPGGFPYQGAPGAVRIIWPGDKRQFPSTLVDKR